MNCASVSPSGITIYKEYLYSRVRMCEECDFGEETTTEIKPNNKAEAAVQNLKKRFEKQGLMGPCSQKKMKRALEWLLIISKEKKIYSRFSQKWVKARICFITLTLPSKQIHTDQEIKKRLLNSLLTELRKFHGVKCYVWRAEKQANGNIHFHLIVNQFIEASKLRERWNRICNVLGYVDRYQDKMKSEIHCFGDYYEKFIKQGSYIELMRRYLQGRHSGWSNPNSIDIHSVKKVKNLVVYLFKYMSKNVENIGDLTEEQRSKLLVSGQVWGLSENLSKMKNVSIPIDTQVYEELCTIWNEVKSYEKISDFFEYKSVKLITIAKKGCTEIINHVIQRLTEVFGIHELNLNLLK